MTQQIHAAQRLTAAGRLKPMTQWYYNTAKTIPSWAHDKVGELWNAELKFSNHKLTIWRDKHTKEGYVGYVDDVYAGSAPNFKAAVNDLAIKMQQKVLDVYRNPKK